jgi:hypothetical protein
MEGSGIEEISSSIEFNEASRSNITFLKGFFAVITTSS